MLRLEKFDGKKTYMFVDGSIATPEAMLKKNQAMAVFTHVLEINGDVVQAIMNLSALRGIYKIDKEMSDDDAILAIESIINAPPAPEPVGPEERLAAAQEFSNVMMLDDIDVQAKSLEVINSEPFDETVDYISEDPYVRLVKKNFDRGLWSTLMLDKALKKGVLTPKQHKQIRDKK